MKNIKNIRDEIDTVDKGIVELIAKRSKLVHNLADFKSSIDEIKDKGRIDEVLQNVRGNAISLNLSPNLIEEVYSYIIDEMVEMEIAEFENKKVF